MLALAAGLDPNVLIPGGSLAVLVAAVLRVLWRTNSDARRNEQTLRDAFAAERLAARAEYAGQIADLRLEIVDLNRRLDAAQGRLDAALGLGR